MSRRRGAWICVWIRVSLPIRIGICRASVVGCGIPRPPAVCRICGRLPLQPVVLRSWLIRPLLILVGTLLRLIWSLLVLIPALLILKRTLLIPVWPILPALQLSVTELPLRCPAIKSALARRRDHAQAQEQDCPGYCRRTHSFRVGSPVQNSFSERAPPAQGPRQDRFTSNSSPFEDVRGGSFFNEKAT